MPRSRFRKAGQVLVFSFGLFGWMLTTLHSQSPTPSVTPASTGQPQVGPYPGSGVGLSRPATVPAAGVSRPGTMSGMPGMPGMMGPPMSESQWAELQLGEQARDMLRRYATETNPESKVEIKKSLRGVLIGQFELQHRRRDDELKKIEKRLAELRSKLTRRAEAKDTIVDRRLDQLVNDVDGLGWGADDLPRDLFDTGTSPFSGAPSGSAMGTMGQPGPFNPLSTLMRGEFPPRPPASRFPSAAPTSATEPAVEEPGAPYANPATNPPLLPSPTKNEPDKKEPSKKAIPPDPGTQPPVPMNLDRLPDVPQEGTETPVIPKTEF